MDTWGAARESTSQAWAGVREAQHGVKKLEGVCRSEQLNSTHWEGRSREVDEASGRGGADGWGMIPDNNDINNKFYLWSTSPKLKGAVEGDNEVDMKSTDGTCSSNGVVMA